MLVKVEGADRQDWYIYRGHYKMRFHNSINQEIRIAHDLTMKQTPIGHSVRSAQNSPLMSPVKVFGDLTSVT